MESNQLKKTPLYDVHVKAGAKMVQFGDYLMPAWYKGIIDEHLACRQNVVIFDINHMDQIEVVGEDRDRFVNRACTNDIRIMDIYQCQYNLILNHDANIIDDCIVNRFADSILIVVNAGKATMIKDHFNQIKGDLKVDITDISAKTGMLAIQGPKCREIYRMLFAEDFNDLGYFHFKQTSWKGNEIIVSRTGYTGSPGFEIMFDTTINETIWNAIVEIGDDFGLLPAGLGARDILRLEMGYPLHGNDLKGHNPIEARLTWVIGKEKESFYGRIALMKIKETGVDRNLCAFKLNERAVPRHGYDILSPEGEPIGEVTSGGYSPMLNQGIGLGYIRKDYAKSGNSIKIQIRKQQYEAVVTKLPFIPSKVK